MSLKPLAMLVACVGLAAPVSAAGVTKFTAFLPWGPGTSENPNVDGMCTLKYEGKIQQGQLINDQTRIHIVLHNLQPNTTYGVQVTGVIDGNRDGGTAPFAFTTSSNGMGTYSSVYPRNLTNIPRLYIFKFDGNWDAIDDVTLEYRADYPYEEPVYDQFNNLLNGPLVAPPGYVNTLPVEIRAIGVPQ
jgi:hypothetical protein